MKRYDLHESQYGVNPPAFMRDALDRIGGELDPGEEATISINPERFPEDPQVMAAMAPEAGMSVVSTTKLAPDELEIQVKKAPDIG